MIDNHFQTNHHRKRQEQLCDRYPADLLYNIMSLPIAAADLTFACDNVSANHSKGQYSATLLCANVNTYLIPVHPWAVQYMLNDVLCNLRGICKRINSICVRPVCVLENGACKNVTPVVILMYLFWF